MIVFGAITSKTIRAPYSIEVDGYMVSGYATYDKENKLTDASGFIKTAEGQMVGSFNIYGAGEDKRINLNDCNPERMNDAVEVARNVIESLSATYPRE
jgi:hypothetical protein